MEKKSFPDVIWFWVTALLVSEKNKQKKEFSKKKLLYGYRIHLHNVLEGDSIIKQIYTKGGGEKGGG